MRPAQLIGKPLFMPTLAARFARTTPRAGFRRVLAAQALSWGGDLALMGRSRTSFLTGLASFLGAHVVYVSAYRSRSSQAVLASPRRRRLLAAGAALTSAMAVAAARQDRALGLPVAAYGLTLTSMVATAAAIDPARGRDRIVVGATLFLLSDTLIGVRKFLGGEESPALEAAVAATYTTGQWAISSGMSCP